MTVSRRKILASGLGVSALPLTLQQSLADQRFVNYAFQATGAPTPRTMPSRLAEVKNVLDFGADPSSSVANATATTAAIQAAVNWTTNPNRGTIFFPAGNYVVNSPITFNGVSINDELSIQFVGVGAASAVLGDVNGYIFDRSSGSPNNTKGLRGFQNLGVSNTHSNGGCIRMGSTDGGFLRNCSIGGFNGFTSEDSPGVSSTNILIDVCNFGGTGQGNLGGISCTIGGSAVVMGCDNRNNDTGWCIYGSGFVASGNRTENTNTAWLIGKDSGGTARVTSGFAIYGAQCEGNDTGFYFTGGPCSAFVLVACGAQGHDLGNNGYPIGGPGPGAGASHYGTRIDAGVAQSGIFQVCSNSSNAIVASWQIGDASSPANLVFMDCSGNQAGSAGVSWIIPTNAQTAQFIRCNITPAPIWTFSQLPTGGNRQEGDEFNVSDINGTWGTTYTGGGTTHGVVRFNGTNWTVMGV